MESGSYCTKNSRFYGSYDGGGYFFSFNSPVRSIKAHIRFDISKPLVHGAWIPNQSVNAWIEFKYERLPKFFYYYEKLTHLSRFCENVNGINITLEVRILTIRSC